MKIILAAIAVGLWLNAFMPMKASGDDAAFALRRIENHLTAIEDDLSSISHGLCLNDALCR